MAIQANYGGAEESVDGTPKIWTKGYSVVIAISTTQILAYMIFDGSYSALCQSLFLNLLAHNLGIME